MKKRMFLTTALMALVLLLAVTTATFAWYQASDAGVSVKDYVSAEQLQTQDAKFGSGDFNVKIAVNADAKNLAYTDANGKTAYVLQDGETIVRNVAIPEDQVAEASGNITVTITYASEGLTVDEVQAAWGALELTKVTVDLTGSNDVKLALGDAHAYAANANNTITLSEVSLGTVKFAEVGGKIVATVTVGSFTYAIAGQDEVQGDTVGKIAANNGSLS